MGLATARRKPENERTKEPEAAARFSLGHWIKVEALAILNDGEASPSQIAKLIGADVRLVGNHIRYLFDAGSIEEAGTAKVRNATEHFYRAVSLPYIGEEEYLAMPKQIRRELAALILQAITAESFASLRAKKIEDDDDVWLTWQRVNLDKQGKREYTGELKDTFGRMQDIQARNAARLAESEEAGTTHVVVLMGFERSRPGRPNGGYGPPTGRASPPTEK